MTRVTHEFEPVYDERSRILILGTFPSVKSREGQFYYHHPRNRFWQVLSRLTKEPLPETIREKKELLLRRQIALWDVIASCEIKGSSDSSIRNVIPADIPRILKAAPIERIFANGGAAHRLYGRYCQKETAAEAVLLPSTSPANAAFSLERLVELWGKALEGYL